MAAFHDQYFQPGRAIITVVGDVEPDAVRATVDEALSGWSAGGGVPSFDYPPVPRPQPRAIYLVDKPGAPQSVFAIVITSYSIHYTKLYDARIAWWTVPEGAASNQRAFCPGFCGNLPPNA